MNRILAFGDSFVVGDQDDFLPPDCNYNPKYPPQHNMNYDQRVEYLKSNISFASLIAKELGYDYINFAQRGLGNFVQLDILLSFIKSGQLEKTDIILFGLTTNGRDRISLMFDSYDKKSTEVRIIDSNLKEPENWDTIEEFDYFYIISILDMISKKYKIPVIKFNLFSNTLCNVTGCLDYHSDNFIGLGLSNNTLIDVLNDTWGLLNKDKHVYHTELIIPKGYEKFYTWNKHPSIEGHKKISTWFLDIIDWDNLKYGK
jgi:hypothetical protein